MGMTMTEKILAAHAGLPCVKAGDLIEAKLDLVLGNDITTPVAITTFEAAGLTKIFDQDKIAIVLDHYTPCKDIKSAELCAQARALPKSTASRTCTTWARRALSMRFFRKRVLSPPETA